MALEFSKYQGTGNDFVIVNCLEQTELSKLLGKTDTVKNICSRRFGIGADGLILVLPAEQNGDIKMVIFNSDGSEAEMCGNGIRCFVRYLADNNIIEHHHFINIETLAGIIKAKIDNTSDIIVDMGPPILKPELIPTTFEYGNKTLVEGKIKIKDKSLNCYAVGMGNPHLISFVDDFINCDIEQYGPILEMNKSFPNKTNVHFVKVKSKTNLEIRTWERGCGITQACGTGACASLVASSLLELTNFACKIDMPGGSLVIEWPHEHSNVLMKGPAIYIFEGTTIIS